MSFYQTTPNSWINALNAYSYPVNLGDYERAPQFPGFFNQNILGDRNSTIAFENYYQTNACHHIEVFFEVVYWKLYSQPHIRNRITSKIVNFVQTHGITSNQLWSSIQQFIISPNITNLEEIRNKLGLRTPVLAVPLTLVALANPQKFPMIDNQVARWVNSNASNHNDKRRNKLSLFNMKYTSLRYDDFPNYLNWVNWCQEVAQVLTELTSEQWRARDVEMAVFTAQRNGMTLNVLP
jgi:hypothetical protein